MDKRLTERLAALKAKADSHDPKGIDSIVDAVSEDDAFIQKVVEKIMSKMDADGEAGKYRVDAHATNKKQAAYSRVLSIVRQAFDGSMAPPSDGAGKMSPMDPMFGETPASESAEASVPELKPVQKLEDEATKFGDPALDALVNVIELLIKKDMGNKLPSEAKPAGPAAPMDDDSADEEIVVPPPVEKKKSPVPPVFGGADKEEDDGDGNDDEVVEVEEAPDKKKSSPFDKKDEEEEEAEPIKSVEARLRALVSLPKKARLVRAQQLRQLAEVAESGELPDFMKKDDEDEEKDGPVDKEAMKAVLRAALAALEAGENDKEYTMPADPEDYLKKQEELDKEAAADRKAKVLAHVAKLRMQKEATVDGKSMPTPKEVPSPEGTTEDTLSGDAKIQYQNVLGDVNLGEIQLKRQKVPTDKAHGDEAVMYSGNNPAAKREIQTEKDSSKDVNNKRDLPDMGTAVQVDHPASSDEQMEMGKGTHQKEKSWDAAKSESDKTPTGPRLVGLASSDDTIGRAIKLARLAQEKGLVASEDQYDELVTRYASYTNEKFAMAVEMVEDAPSRTASKKHTAEADVNEDYEAVEDAEEEKQPKSAMLKREAEQLESAKALVAANKIKSVGISKYITTVSDGESLNGHRPPKPNISDSRFAALGDLGFFPWKGVATSFYEAEANGSLDQTAERKNFDL